MMPGKLYIFWFVVLLLEFCGVLAEPGSWAATGRTLGQGSALLFEAGR